MLQITTVATGKGGPGKTITGRECIAELSRRGVKTLVIDLDQQGNMTKALGFEPETVVELEGTAAEVLAGEGGVTAQAAAVPVDGLPGVSLLPAYDDLRTLSDLAPTRIRDLAREWGSDWQHIVIDTPPAMDGLSLAALVAATRIVSPVLATEFALDGLDRLAGIIRDQINPILAPTARIDWVVPNQIDVRRAVDREVLELLEEEYPGRVTNPIRKAVAVEYSVTARQPVTVYAPKSAVAEDYRAAVARILN